MCRFSLGKDSFTNQNFGLNCHQVEGTVNLIIKRV